MRKRPIRTMRIESHRVRSPVEPVRSWSPRWCECAVSVLHTHGCVCVRVKLCVGIGVGVDVGGRGGGERTGARVKSRGAEQSRAEHTQHTILTRFRSGRGQKTEERDGLTGNG